MNSDDGDYDDYDPDALIRAALSRLMGETHSRTSALRTHCGDSIDEQQRLTARSNRDVLRW